MRFKSKSLLWAFLIAGALAIQFIHAMQSEANIRCNKNIKPDWSDCGSDRGLCCPIGDGD
jgi:hypothetical protein